MTSQKPDVMCLIPTATKIDEEIQELSRHLGVKTVVVDAPALEPVGEIDISRTFINDQLFKPVRVDVDGIVVVADADDMRAEFVRSLVRAFGIDVRVFGSGWQIFADLDSNTYGTVTAIDRPSLMQKAALVIALPRSRDGNEKAWVADSSSTVALEAIATGRPCVSPLESRIPEIPSYSSITNFVASVGEALENLDELAERVQALRRTIRSSHDVLCEIFGQLDSPLYVRKGPRVSVIMSAYNSERFIGNSIESILNQTVEDLELLICDDGSTDSTPSVVARYLGDLRVKMFSQDNIGRTGRYDLIRRTILEQAQGDYISTLDSDDISMPDHFERALEAFDSDAKLGLVHSAGIRIDENGLDQGDLFALDYGYNDSSQLRDLMFRCYVANPTSLVRRDVFERAGLMEEGFAHDYHLWLKMARYFRFRYLPERLIKYRMHAEGASSIGSGRDTAESQGARTRRAERERVSMLDLYPALVGNVNERDYAAAHVDLGLRFIRGLVDVDFGFEEWERAIEISDGNCLEAEWNTVLLLAQLGRSHEAEIRLQRLRQRHEAFVHSHTEGNARFAEGIEISTVPFQIPDAVWNSAVWWDGMPVNKPAVLVLPNWSDTKTLETFMARSVTEFSSANICVATLGILPRLANDLLNSVGSWPETVLIKRIDSAEFVPKSKYMQVVDLR